MIFFEAFWCFVAFSSCAHAVTQTSRHGSGSYPLLRRQSDGSVPLRIMVLGASVAWGTGSTTGNSYRKPLRDLLVNAGYTVNFVGSHANGQFTDNQVEATPGFVTSQIAEAAASNVPIYKPNLVMLEAGSNDCLNGGTVPDAGNNVRSIIEGVYRDSPGATVVLTNLLVVNSPNEDGCRVDQNSQFANLAAEMQSSGQSLGLVDMRGSGGPTIEDLSDVRHPNDGGYAKMATIWYGGINDVIQRGLLTPADPSVGEPDDGGA